MRTPDRLYVVSVVKEQRVVVCARDEDEARRIAKRAALDDLDHRGGTKRVEQAARLTQKEDVPKGWAFEVPYGRGYVNAGGLGIDCDHSLTVSGHLRREKKPCR